MIFTPKNNDVPLRTMPPYSSRKKNIVEPPRSALPLIKPLLKNDPPLYEATPWRILQNIRTVSVCAHGYAAIDKDDCLWTWGAKTVAKDDDDYECLYLPQDVNYIPKMVRGDIASVSAGVCHYMCIAYNGDLYGWGRNKYGELGLGDCQERIEPTFIMPGVSKVFARYDQTYIIKADGSLWGCGCIPNNETPSFQFLHLLDNIVHVCASEDIAFVITSDSVLWGWGKCILGSDILFSSTNSNVSNPIPLMTDVRSAKLPCDLATYAFAVTNNNDLYSIGTNGDLGSYINYTSRLAFGKIPVKIISNVKDAYAQRNCSLVLLLDGRLYSRGRNDNGQCGTGKISSPISTPRLIMYDVVEAALGHNHGLALQSNGDVWIWGGDYSEHKGSNTRGQCKRVLKGT